ncbi:cytochrome c oxidase subunit II [Sulfurospirillum sp. 1612]|uniref:cytochrome c oxidase subunit II n=1 Tax=Sulfurospirillum sp. 1612 TaxID=3094835 RepID=UPI002F9346AD
MNKYLINGIEGVSSFASQVDMAMLVVFGITTVVFLIVIGVMFYFAYKYSSKRHARKDIVNIEHNSKLEIAWTILPMFLLAIMFYYGMTSLKIIREVPKDNMEVKVTGQMWFWTHEYPNGKVTTDLYVPIGKNVKLDITAKTNDVLHSYYIPAFRFKQDAVPGYVYHSWFNPTKLGVYDIECAEYCGVGHSRMLAKVHVLSQKDFDAWYNSDKKTPFSKESKTKENPGLALLKSNGCLGCHSLDGSPLVGPSYKGLFGRKTKVLVNGKVEEVVANAQYLKESILKPNAKVVEGFTPGMMSSYKGVLSDKQIDQIIDYLKNGDKPKKVDIKEKATSLLQSNGCLGCHSLDGSKLIGPSYKGMYGHKTKVLVKGKEEDVVANDAYLKESILDPDAKIVKGYSGGMMAPYRGILSDDDINTLIQYFKTLKD